MEHHGFNGYRRLMAGLAVLGFVSGIFADRMWVERREAAIEQRVAVLERDRELRDVSQRETLARIESRLRSVEANNMELLVQMAELNTILTGQEVRRRRKP